VRWPVRAPGSVGHAQRWHDRENVPTDTIRRTFGVGGRPQTRVAMTARRLPTRRRQPLTAPECLETSSDWRRSTTPASAEPPRPRTRPPSPGSAWCCSSDVPLGPTRTPVPSGGCRHALQPSSRVNRRVLRFRRVATMLPSTASAVVRRDARSVRSSPSRGAMPRHRTKSKPSSVGWGGRRLIAP
jgi:hypothetical protein